MIFETLYRSSQDNELLLVKDGMCHWHLRRDGQLTIREIISTKPGAGGLMLRRLLAVPGATSLLAKCPADLAANSWYAKRGFQMDHTESTHTGKALNVWKLDVTQQRRRPNMGNLEIIFCSDGGKFADIALDAGMLVGAQLPSRGLRYRPYFADQDWRAPNRERYMTVLAEHRPAIATVLDWERLEQFDEVMSWAEEAAKYAETVVIVPKVHNAIQRLPRKVGEATVRLGYSVPTRYAGTNVALPEFAGWPVHLLGGSPHEQIRLARLLDVWSVDTNYTQKMALLCQFWSNGFVRGKNNYWPQLAETDGRYTVGGPYEAFRRSCVNIMGAWEEFLTQPKQEMQMEYQRLLPFPA